MLLLRFLSKVLPFLFLSWLLSFLTHSSIAQENSLDLGSGDNATTNITCPSNVSCSSLPYHCITCDIFSGANCTYGQNTTFNCSPIDDVLCEGPDRFNITAMCRFCYQLPEPLTCCTPNTTCSVKGSPRPMYTSQCTAVDTELCIPPRSFQKRLPCNYTTGKRWSIAFVLSIVFGGFGVDRFYLEHWGSAVGKLLSFGGLGVWSIIDVILVATGYLTPADGSAYVY